MAKLQPFFPGRFLNSMECALGFMPSLASGGAYLVIVPISDGKTIDHERWKTMPLLSIVMLCRDGLEAEAVTFGYHTLYADPPIPRGFTYSEVPPGGNDVFGGGIQTSLHNPIVLARGLSHLQDVLNEDSYELSA